MSFKHQHTLSVRFSDADMLAHTNNAVYFSYMEEARLSYFGKLGYEAKEFHKRCPFILASASCDFKSPSFITEELVVYLGVTEIRRSSFIMEYEIKEKSSQRLVALGKTTQVTYDFGNHKVMSVPQELREKIEAMEGKKCPPIKSQPSS